MSPTQIRVLVTIDDGVERREIEAAMPETADITLVGLVEGLDSSWAVIQETTPDLLIVACAGDSDRAVFLIDAAVKQQPERPVVVLTTATSPNGFVRRVFDAGADDVVTLPAGSDDVRFAIEKAFVRRRGGAAAASATLGSLICILGPKGGTGKTLSTCNLGVALATAGKRVAIVDLDLQFGDVGLSLGLSPDRTIYDLVKAGGDLDADKVDGFLAVHESGVRVLMAPSRPDQANAVTTRFLHEVYATLRASFDYVIVDTPPGFTPEVIATIDSAQYLCMVGMLDSLSLKNTKLGMETLELMGYDRERIRILLNRHDSRVGISKDDVSAILGCKPDVLVPSDRDIPRHVNQGQTLVAAMPRSEVATAYRELAAFYIGADSTTTNGNGHKRRRFGKKG